MDVEGVLGLVWDAAAALPDLDCAVQSFSNLARHSKASFESFDKDLPGSMPGFLSAYKWVNAFRAGEPNRGLVLHGSVGRGKTHLLIASVEGVGF